MTTGAAFRQARARKERARKINTLLRHASRRFQRRRRDWIGATKGMTFKQALKDPTWAYVDEANELLLRLGRALDEVQQ